MTNWPSEGTIPRLVRFADLLPSSIAQGELNASTDTEAQNLPIFGPEVFANASEEKHLRNRAGLSIAGLRQSVNCASSQHSYGGAEIVIVHSGRWRVYFGPNQEDGLVEISPGDVFSVPPLIFRGFEEVDEGQGFLWIARADNPSDHAAWTSAVYEASIDDEIKLARAGRFIDTSAGYHVLKDGSIEQPTSGSPEQSKTPLLDRLNECVARADALSSNPLSPLAGEGIEEAGIIASRPTSDGFSAGPISGWWPHRFNLRRLTLQSGAYIPMHARSEAEVLFMQSGTMEVSWSDGTVMLGAGDTLSVPVWLQHAFRNTASVPAVLFVVRGCEDPAMPVFASTPAAEIDVQARSNEL